MKERICPEKIHQYNLADIASSYSRYRLRMTWSLPGVSRNCRENSPETIPSGTGFMVRSDLSLETNIIPADQLDEFAVRGLYAVEMDLRPDLSENRSSIYCWTAAFLVALTAVGSSLLTRY